VSRRKNELKRLRRALLPVAAPAGVKSDGARLLRLYEIAAACLGRLAVARPDKAPAARAAGAAVAEALALARRGIERNGAHCRRRVAEELARVCGHRWETAAGAAPVLRRPTPEEALHALVTDESLVAGWQAALEEDRRGG